MMKKQLVRDNPYMRMVVNILSVANIIDRKVSDALKSFGITHVQFNILRSLEACYPQYLSVNEINNGLVFKSPDVTRLLDRLEKRELIVRKTCENNRRKVDVGITDKGLDVIDNSLPAIANTLDNYYMDLVNDSERDILNRVLKKIKG